MEILMNAMEQHGWAVQLGIAADQGALRLRQECVSASQNGEFRRAGVGRGHQLEIRDEIRGDQVMWLDPDGASAEQKTWLAKLEQLRLALNQRFFLGLLDYEGHFAIYPIGSFYKAHLDRHSGTSTRVVTVILYLNEDWQQGDGGELKLWTSPEGKDGEFQLIEPRMGTLVCFMAGEFWHEVMPAAKSRMSITGWFRQR